MNLKSLMSVIIKIFAIYILVQAALIIPDMLWAMGFASHDASGSNELFFFLGIVVTFLIYLLIARFMIFKTDWIVERIIRSDQLESDFSSFKIHRSTVLTIAVIVIGGLVLIQEIPSLIRNIYNHRARDINDFSTGLEFDLMAASLVKILIGIYLVTKNRTIVNWIEKRRKK